MTQIRLKPRNNYQDFVNYIALGRLSQNVPSYYFYSLVVEKLIIFKQKFGIDVKLLTYGGIYMGFSYKYAIDSQYKF